MQCDKVKVTESVSLYWKKVKQTAGNVDEEEEPEGVETLTSYGPLLYSTTITTHSCLNSEEASVIVDSNSPRTGMKIHKHSVSQGCGLSLDGLLKVLRVYAKKMKRRDLFVSFVLIFIINYDSE